jgi:septum site-determining protein MinC
MALASAGNSPSVFDLKSATLTLVALVVKSPRLPELAEQLRLRLGPSTEFFNQDPVLIDLAQIQDSPEEIDFRGLIELMRSYSMVPVAVRGGSAAQMEAAQAARCRRRKGRHRRVRRRRQSSPGPPR